jgi:cytochrome c oxidase subunit III
MSTTNHGHHHPALAHHFRSMSEQFDAAKLGIWLFLCTEILMFGGLFVGYIIFHGLYPEMFAEGAKQLDWRLGAVNTIVLLFSSFTMAAGIHFAQKNDKYFEYTHKFHLGFSPGKFFSAENVEHANLALYFSFYFLMTGLHGSHVLVGMGLIIWVMIRTKKGEFSSEFYTPVEGVGLFWHLVDLIWIYLFPLLYLVG